MKTIVSEADVDFRLLDFAQQHKRWERWTQLSVDSCSLPGSVPQQFPVHRSWLYSHQSTWHTVLAVRTLVWSKEQRIYIRCHSLRYQPRLP